MNGIGLRLNLIGTKHGLGIHAWDLPINQFSLFSKVSLHLYEHWQLKLGSSRFGDAFNV